MTNDLLEVCREAAALGVFSTACRMMSLLLLLLLLLSLLLVVVCLLLLLVVVAVVALSILSLS